MKLRHPPSQKTLLLALLLLLGVSEAVAGWAIHRSSSRTAAPLTPADFVELTQQNGAWGGPTYTLRLSAGGQLHWQGVRQVARLGEATAAIPSGEAQRLITTYRDHGFANLAASYETPATDLPATLTTLSLGATRKTVRDYGQAAPAWLREANQQLLILAADNHWL